MAYLAVLDITGMTTGDYDAVLAEMNVENEPSPGIYVHFCAETDNGIRVVELWDDEGAFRQFLKDRLAPASEKVGISADTTVSITHLHNVFAPRLDEIPSTKPVRP